MNSIFKKILSAFVIVVAVVTAAVYFFGSNNHLAGAVAIPTQQNAESATIAGYFSESIATAGVLFMGGHNSDTYTVAQFAQAGACTSGTSTIVSQINPFGATSTVEIVSLFGTDGTSTIKLFAGTSTTASIVGVLNSRTLLNTGNISTSTNFYTSSMTTAGPVGFIPNGTSNVAITVGANEYVVVQATSTTGSTADNAAITQTGSTLACTYKLVWTK